MLRFALVPDTFCCFRIHGAFPLCLPVKLSSGICHLVIDLTGTADTFGNVCCMCCDLGCHDSLFYVFKIRKCKVLCRCYIAEECCSGHSCYCAADRGCDVVISRCNVSYDRS